MTCPHSRSRSERLAGRLLRRPCLEKVALRALRRATELLGLAIGTRLARMRESDLSHNRLGAKIEEQALLTSLLSETNRVLAERWEKIPDRHRPHYTPQLRYRILRLKGLLALSQPEAARMFAVSVHTIARWEAETEVESETGATGSLVRPQPPVRRYADVLRHLVQSMALAGFGGNDLIARTLARAGWKIASRTVGRVRKEKPTRFPVAQLLEKARGGSVKARFQNHVWMADLTEIPGLFHLFSFKLAVVFDVFSRMPLAARVFLTEPRARVVANLFARASQRYGAPRHFVSDKGAQFTARVFRRTLSRLSVRHRFGAVGKAGSIAVIERLWRTLKDTLALRSLRPLVLADCRRRLGLGLLHYSCSRPHQSLGGATPAEIYFGLTRAYLSAVQPPRGRRGEGPKEPPLQIVYLDPERLLPILVEKAA